MPPETGWIPVTERLPEWKEGSDNLYLVTRFSAFRKISDIDIAYFYKEKALGWECPVGYEVVAWMPLPKPYEEGAEDGNG